MKKYQVFSHLGNLCTIAAFILGIKGFTNYAGIIFCVAYIFLYCDLFIISAPYQFISLFILYVGVADLLLKYNSEFPFLSIAVLLFLPVGLIRSVWLDFFTHTRFLWLEPLTWFPGFAFYIYGNVTGNFGWQVWIFPLPALLGTGYLVTGFLLDGFRLIKESKRDLSIVPGSIAPGFVLKDNQDKDVSLEEYRGKNLLLIFVRGDWCPFCHMMLRTYQKRNNLFLKKGIHLLVIGPDPVGVNKEMAEKLGLDFKMLSDEKLEATKLYGLRITEHFAPHGEVYDEEKSIPLPASFLIDKKGVVLYVSRPDRIGATVTFDDIFPLVEKIQ